MKRRLLGLLLGTSLLAWGCSATASPTPVPSIAGTAGHFDDGQEAFDYPLDWNVLAGGHSSVGGLEYIIAVLGDGSWSESCETFTTDAGSGAHCTQESTSYPPGGIVVKIYSWQPAPLIPCRGDVQANATFGSLAVRKTMTGDVTSWEIRVPGNEFGQNNNIFVEAHSSDPFQLTKAEQLVAGFRWLGAPPAMGCSSSSPA